MIKNEQERQRIGQHIAQLRKEKGMTQQDLANRVEMQRSHIARIEAGRYSVGLDTLAAIAQALGKRLALV
jgi:transcriptional regulator with XRE-family HTH domain